MNPTNAEHFAATMRDIWDGAGECEDALAIARINASQVREADNGMDELAFLFRFSDGSHAVVSEGGVMVTDPNGIQIKDRTP